MQNDENELNEVSWDDVFSLSNVLAKKLGLNVNVKFNIRQPGAKKVLYGPRVKVFRARDLDGGFFINLGKDPDEVVVSDNNAQNSKTIVNQEELMEILKHLKKYRMAYLFLWNNPGYGSADLSDLFKAVDAGKPLDANFIP